jgi:pimeloyl-ACP methyl ester carboxylesterase
MIPITTLDDVAAAVATGVEDAGLDSPVMVGHSISGVVAAIYATTYPTSGVVDVDQELDTSFIRMLQANRGMVTGPGFTQLWPAILASMRLDLLPTDARDLLNSDLPRQDVVLAYWREALATPLPDLERRITESVAVVRRLGIPILIVTGHPYDAVYSAWLQATLPDATVTVVPDSGHFPHLADPDLFAGILAQTGQWRTAPASAVGSSTDW